MNPIATLSAVFGLSTALACHAAPPPSASYDYQRLASSEAYVLVDVGTRGALGHYVSSLNFSDKQAGVEMSIPRERGMQLIKVKAGNYHPEALGIAARGERNKTRSVAQKYSGDGIEIEAGTVTYIGNWNIRYGQRVNWVDSEHLVEVAEYGVHFSPDAVEAFYNENDWIGEYPLRVAHMNGKRVASPWIFNEDDAIAYRLAQAAKQQRAKMDAKQLAQVESNELARATATR